MLQSLYFGMLSKLPSVPCALITWSVSVPALSLVSILNREDDGEIVSFVSGASDMNCSSPLGKSLSCIVMLTSVKPGLRLAALVGVLPSIGETDVKLRVKYSFTSGNVSSFTGMIRS